MSALLDFFAESPASAPIAFIGDPGASTTGVEIGGGLPAQAAQAECPASPASELRPPRQLELRDRWGRPLGRNKSSSDIEAGAGGRSDAGKQSRRRIYALQRAAQEFNPPDGPAALPFCCHRPAIRQDAAGEVHASPFVRVQVDAAGRASWGELQRCGSVWTCPVCASRISIERTSLLRTMLEEHLRQGRERAGGLFLTVTIAHELTDELRELRGRLVTKAWARLRTTYTWKRMQRSGYLGDVRTLEVTVGERNGWHPHLHDLLLFDHQPTEQERAELEEALFREWASCCARAGLPEPQRWAIAADGTRKGLGVNLEVLTEDTDAIASYVLKMGAAFEQASWTTKEGRAGNRSIMQLLADVEQYRRPKDIRLWQQWAAAMRGARQFEWSRGKWDLRARFGLRDRTEEEIAADDALDYAEQTVAEISEGVFCAFSRVPGWRARVLELAEEGGGLAVLEFVRRCIDTFRGRRDPPAWYREEVMQC